MPHHHHGRGGRVFWGLMLIALGTLFLLDRMDVYDFGDILSKYWPLIFVILGLSILIGNGFRRSGPAVFFILFGVFFQLAELDVLRYDWWHYFWPGLIILLGLWLLLRGVIRFRPVSTPEIRANDLDISSVFSGVKRRVESAAFRGGRATCVLGGLELDFTGAGLEGGQATIEVTQILGGTEIRVPKDWKVVVDGTPILGGIDEKHRNPPDAEAKATLYVKATSILGGIEILD